MKLFIVYDDRQIDVIDIPQILVPDTDGIEVKNFLQVTALPTYASVRFLHHTSHTFSILVVTDPNDMDGAVVISHTQMILNVDGTVSLESGPFDELSFPQGSRIYVGSSRVVCKRATGELAAWSAKEGDVFCEVSLNLTKSHMEILDVDLDIGLIALKEGGDGILRTPQIKAYWIV